ncbi:MAG: HYC_CC_PP family protein [Ginsengibacter sp.]
MNRKKSIQLKAAFLLIAFSLNTVIGFACSVGLDMGFNSHHHEESATETEGIHQHYKKSNHHDEADVHHHTTNNDKDNCCNDSVMKFQKVDKALASSINIISPVFFTSFIASFYHIDILSSNNSISTIKYFVRSYHPPIPDIRIAIQSFQI